MKKYMPVRLMERLPDAVLEMDGVVQSRLVVRIVSPGGPFRVFGRTGFFEKAFGEAFSFFSY